MRLRFRRRPRPALLPASARRARAGRMRDLVHDAYQAALDVAFEAGYTAALDDFKLTGDGAVAATGHSDRLAVTTTDHAGAVQPAPADTTEVSSK